jgi:hypothetical protein
MNVDATATFLNDSNPGILQMGVAGRHQCCGINYPRVPITTPWMCGLPHSKVPG